MIIQQKKIINSKFLFSWDIEDETLSIKYPSLSTIDWYVLTRVDNQMEEALQQCQQDFIQYEQFSRNIINEMSILEGFFFSIVSFFFYFRFESYNMNIRKNRLFVHKFPSLFSLTLCIK